MPRRGSGEYIVLSHYLTVLQSYCHTVYRGAGAGPAGTAGAVPMLEAKLMNLIKGQLPKF